MCIKVYIPSLLIILLVTGCGQNRVDKSTHTVAAPQVVAVATTYRILTDKDSIKHLEIEYTGPQLNIILALNRTDSAHLIKMDSVIIAADLSADINKYSPFPQRIPYTNINKIIFFSYPAEYFAAYQNGVLVRSGPTNMGRQHDPTPTGLFFTNWKGADVKSSFNDEWDLKWNFNIINDSGIGFHEYDLPGYPASHSCLRLHADDAQFLYNWADEWKVKGKADIIAKGTPVMVFGIYPFGSAKPWFQLANDPHALDITVATIKQLTDTAVNNILAAQQTREKLPK